MPIESVTDGDPQWRPSHVVTHVLATILCMFFFYINDQMLANIIADHEYNIYNAFSPPSPVLSNVWQ